MLFYRAALPLSSRTLNYAAGIIRLAAIADVREEDWDAIALVEYPSRKAFMDMAISKQMGDIHHNREAGLERTVLIACSELGGTEV